MANVTDKHSVGGSDLQVVLAGLAACVIVVAVGTHSQRTTLQQIYSNADQVSCGSASYLPAGTMGGGAARDNMFQVVPWVVAKEKILAVLAPQCSRGLTAGVNR